MQLSEKYRPVSAKDFIGKQEFIKEIMEYVQNAFPVLLISPPGYGKTTLAIVVANELGYQLIEKNSSDKRLKEDLQDLERALKTKTFRKVLYLLDEIDGIKNQKYLAKIVEESKHPIIMTANEEYKISPEIKQVSKHIKMQKPKIEDITKRIKQIARKEGIAVNYGSITTDIRSSINNTFGGACSQKTRINDFDKVLNIFRGYKSENTPLIWLLDNAHNFYKGYKLIEVIRLITLADSIGCRELLSCLPVAIYGKSTHPYYLNKKHRSVENGFNR